MNKWKNADNDKEDNQIEVKIKLPKNTMAFIVNYLSKNNEVIQMGNMQFDGKDIEELKEKE